MRAVRSVAHVLRERDITFGGLQYQGSGTCAIQARRRLSLLYSRRHDRRRSRCWYDSESCQGRTAHQHDFSERSDTAQRLRRE